MSPDNVYAYFKEICTNSPLDITLYNIPVFASMIDVSTVQRISEECPKAVAIKDSSGDIAHMQRMIAAVKPNRPEFVFMTGHDPSLLPMMLIGCEGGTNCTAGLAPQLTRKLYELAKRNDVAEARRVQSQVTTLFDIATGSTDFPESVRLILELRRLQDGCRPLPAWPANTRAIEHAPRRAEATAQPARISAEVKLAASNAAKRNKPGDSCPRACRLIAIELSPRLELAVFAYQVIARNALRTG